MKSHYRYYVFLGYIDLDDDGEEQASIYRTSIDSDTPLNVDQIIEIADEEDDWKIAFGEGNWDLIGAYTIEKKDFFGNTKVIAENYIPASP